MKTSIKVFVQLFVVFALVAGVFGLAQVKPAQAQTTWNLVWSDEFNGSGQPSSANWNYHVGNGYNPGLPGFQGWGNGEWEWYRPEECYQSGGNLVLRGEYFSSPTSIAGRDWYQRSCRITTETKRSIQYGKIEARIQMPNANGSWPAFWMLGDACAGGTSTSNYSAPISYYDTMINNWASCGEVDIMEHKNSETTIYNNIFWDLRTGLFPWTAGQNANYVTTYNGGNANVFHVYAIEWTASQIRWTFDGVQTHLIDTTPATLEEFRRPFHLILNLALGGAFPAMDPVQSQFPLYMNVDYVRVYTAGSGGGATATPAPTSTGGGISTTTWYSVINKNSAKCVDARSSGTANGTAIQQYTCNNTNAQQYQFQATSGGYYRVNNRNNSAQVWDVSGVSTADNALIHLWTYGGGNNQQWLPVSEGGGFYHFVARHSGKCLDVPGASTADSIQLVQYTCNGTGAQSFSLQAH